MFNWLGGMLQWIQGATVAYKSVGVQTRLYSLKFVTFNDLVHGLIQIVQ